MKDKLNLTKKELVEIIVKERKQNCMEEHQTIRKELLDKVVRVLDLRDALQVTLTNNKKTRRIINKYAKTHKKEKDIAKLIEKLEEQEKNIRLNYIYAFESLTNTVFKIVYDESFEKDIPAIYIWYGFDMLDMVFVNDLIRELDFLNSSNVTVEDILEALNYAIYKYVDCLSKGLEYIETFEKSFPYVTINEVEEEEHDE